MNLPTPPFAYYGGKVNLAEWIISQFPAHHTYVEVFGGSGAVLVAKPPAPVEVYNDIDDGLTNFYRVLRDPTLFPELQRRLELTPYARPEFNWARDTWEDTTDPVEKAARWYTVVQQAFSATVLWTSWSYCRTESARGMSSAVSGWLSGIERLPAVHARLRTVQVEQDDWTAILDRFDTADTLFYLDPPYVHATRGRAGRYRHEMADTDHAALVERVQRLQGMVVISGYDSALYDPLQEAGWTRLTRSVAISSDGSGRTRSKREVSVRRKTECLWISPSVVAARYDLFTEVTP